MRGDLLWRRRGTGTAGIVGLALAEGQGRALRAGSPCLPFTDDGLAQRATVVGRFPLGSRPASWA